MSGKSFRGGSAPEAKLPVSNIDCRLYVVFWYCPFFFLPGGAKILLFSTGLGVKVFGHGEESPPYIIKKSPVPFRCNLELHVLLDLLLQW